jgi:hypothetical protein
MNPRSRSMAGALLVLMTSACQCLQAVEERDGGGGGTAGGTAGGSAGGMAGGTAGGTAGGSAGGAASDAGVRCATARDCPAVAGFQFCAAPTPACVNGFCLIECNGPADAGRTCQSSTPECLTCGGTASCAQCRGLTCIFTPKPLVGTCPPPFDDFQNFSVMPFSGRCGAGLVRDGGLAGVWVGRLMTGGSLIDIPALGGTCLGSDLATQVPRTVVSCPTCTFLAVGCE